MGRIITVLLVGLAPLVFVTIRWCSPSPAPPRATPLAQEQPAVEPGVPDASDDVPAVEPPPAAQPGEPRPGEPDPAVTDPEPSAPTGEPNAAEAAPTEAADLEQGNR